MHYAELNTQVKRGLSTAHKSTNGWYRMACPACEAEGKRDTKLALSIKVQTGRYYCLRCGVKGRLRDNLDTYIEANPEVEQEERELYRLTDFYSLSDPAYFGSPTLQPARNYLSSRGVTDAIIADAGVGVSLHDRYFSRRIIVPVADRTADLDSWIGYVGRLWEPPYVDRQLNYNYPFGMARGDMLWNFKALYAETSDPLLVVEGVFDGLRHWPNAVACLGKPGKNHIDLLSTTDRHIVMCLDGDAWKESFSASLQLQLRGKEATFLKLPAGSDPGVIPRNELLEMAEDAIWA